MRENTPAFAEALDSHIEGRYAGEDGTDTCRGCDSPVRAYSGAYCDDCEAMTAEEDEDADPETAS